VQVRSGVVFAWLGPEGSTPPELPGFDAFVAPASHSFAFKGLWHCNWLQAFEVGIDPAHPSFLHRYLEDESSLEAAYGRQFRAASAGDVAGERWPMTRVMREFCQPEIRFESVAEGLIKLTTLRPMTDELTHVRVTHAAFPSTFVIPLSETITITQMHVPVDDTRTYWYSFFTSFDGPARQGDDARPAPGLRLAARLRAAEGPAQPLGLRCRRSSAPAPTSAWARKTSTCTTSGRWRAWARSRTGPASISAPPTR
jgi:phenylpropionate dioxygenase-like ring-hydroxylating dioxygenase large terminal subunit